MSVTFTYPFSMTLIDDTTPTTINDDFELFNLITSSCSVNYTQRTKFLKASLLFGFFLAQNTSNALLSPTSVAINFVH